MEFFLGAAKQALFLTLILTAPPVICAMVVGLVISILQATTQIQEQTLTFVPKLVAVVLILILLGQMMSGQLLTFAAQLFNSFPSFVH